MRHFPSLLVLVLVTGAVCVGADKDPCASDKPGIARGIGSGGPPWPSDGPNTCSAYLSEEKDGIHLELCHGRGLWIKTVLPCKDPNGWCRFESRGVKVTAEFRDPARAVIHWIAPWAGPYDGSGMHSFRSRTLVLFRQQGKITGFTSRYTAIDGITSRQNCTIQRK